MPDITYFDIAMKELESLDSLLRSADETDWYNIVAQTCEQVLEKLMKDILQLSSVQNTIPEYLFGSHQLNHLCRAVNSIYPNTVNREKCSWVGSFYFEVRYPGENFILVTRVEAEDLIAVTKDQAESLVALHNKLVAGNTNFFGG